MDIEWHSPAALKSAPSIELLLVDTEAEVRESLKNSLTLAGFQVTTAEDSVAAIKSLASHHIQLMLLNLNMPDSSGWDVLDYIDANSLKTPTIILSEETTFDAATTWRVCSDTHTQKEAATI